MTAQPKISVIIPMYNAEKHIKKTLQSLSLQTFKDFEVIIVDDGSMDQSKEKAKQALSQYHLTGKIITKKNGGQSSARNRGIKEASNDWIVMPDADDYLQQEYLETLYNTAIQTNSSIVFCDIHKVNDRSIDQESIHKNIKDTKKGKDFFADFINHNIKIGPTCLLINKNLLDDNNILFNENMHYSEEFVFISQILYNSKTVTHAQDKLYNYCLRPGSVSTSANSDKIVDTFNKLQEFESTFSKNNKYDEEFRKKALNRWVLATAHFCAKTMLYEEYIGLMKYLDAKNRIKSLKSEKVDKKTKFASILFTKNIRLFYKIMRNL